MKLTEIPCRILSLSAEEAELLALVDNKSAELANWDNDALYDIIANLSTDLEELVSLGFDIEELKINLNLDDFNPIPIEDKPLNTEKRCPHCDMLL